MSSSESTHPDPDERGPEGADERASEGASERGPEAAGERHRAEVREPASEARSANAPPVEAEQPLATPPRRDARDSASDSLVDEHRFRLAEVLAGIAERGETYDAGALGRRYELDPAEVEALAAAAFALNAPAAGEGGSSLPRPDLPADLELGEELGRGGMGVVYRAHQRTLGRDVAVKVLMPGELVFGGALRRFRREAKSLARLRHPHIVSIHEVGESGGHVYYSMDLIEGGTLADLVRDGGLTVARSLRLVRQVASAIRYVHEQGVVHRDLKPQNVLIDANGDAYVADFGLARDLALATSNETQATVSGHLLGTPAYMAPEQARGDRDAIGEATDIYALGALLYECLGGRAPFAGRPLVEVVYAVLHEEPPKLRSLDPTLPAALDWIVRKAMAKEPSERYPTAQAFLEDLDRFVEGRGVRAEPPRVRARLARFARRERRSIGASLATLLVALFAFQVFLASRGAAPRSDMLELVDELQRTGERRAAGLLAERLVDAEGELPRAEFATVQEARFDRAQAARREERPEDARELALAALDELARRREVLVERLERPRVHFAEWADELEWLARLDAMRFAWQLVREDADGRRQAIRSLEEDVARAEGLGLRGELLDRFTSRLARGLGPEAGATGFERAAGEILAQLSIDSSFARPLMTRLVDTPEWGGRLVERLVRTNELRDAHTEARFVERLPWSELLGSLDFTGRWRIWNVLSHSGGPRGALAATVAWRLAELPWPTDVTGEPTDPTVEHARELRSSYYFTSGRRTPEAVVYGRRIGLVVSELLQPGGEVPPKVAQWLRERTGIRTPWSADQWRAWAHEGGLESDWISVLASELGVEELVERDDFAGLVAAFHRASGRERRQLHWLLRLVRDGDGCPLWPGGPDANDEPAGLADRWQRLAHPNEPAGTRLRYALIRWAGLVGEPRVAAAGFLEPDADLRLRFEEELELEDRHYRTSVRSRRYVDGTWAGSAETVDGRVQVSGHLTWRSGALAVEIDEVDANQSFLRVDRPGLEPLAELGEVLLAGRVFEGAASGASVLPVATTLILVSLETSEDRSPRSLEEWTELVLAEARSLSADPPKSAVEAGRARRRLGAIAVQRPFLDPVAPVDARIEGAEWANRLDAFGSLAGGGRGARQTYRTLVDWAVLAALGETAEIRDGALEKALAARARQENVVAGLPSVRELEAERTREMEASIAAAIDAAGHELPERLASAGEILATKRRQRIVLAWVGGVLGLMAALGTAIGLVGAWRKRRKAPRRSIERFEDLRTWLAFLDRGSLFALFMTLYLTGWGALLGWAGPYVMPVVLAFQAFLAHRAGREAGHVYSGIPAVLFSLAALGSICPNEIGLAIATNLYEFAFLSIPLLFVRSRRSGSRLLGWLRRVWFVAVYVFGGLIALSGLHWTLALAGRPGVDTWPLFGPLLDLCGGPRFATQTPSLVMVFYLLWLTTDGPEVVFGPRVVEDARAAGTDRGPLATGS